MKHKGSPSQTQWQKRPPFLLLNLNIKSQKTYGVLTDVLISLSYNNPVKIKDFSKNYIFYIIISYILLINKIIYLLQWQRMGTHIAKITKNQLNSVQAFH